MRTQSRWRPVLAAPLALVALAACAAPGATDQPNTTREPLETVAPSESASVEPVVDAPAGIPEAVWTAILDDLGSRLDEPVTDVTVLEATAMTWNDGSLGCPEPGQAYTQALVDGYHVVLEAAGERWDYRAGTGSNVRLCEGASEGG